MEKYCTAQTFVNKLGLAVSFSLSSFFYLSLPERIFTGLCNPGLTVEIRKRTLFTAF
ncbi:hypothetical protein DCCM_2277 [Desulfocucumis palustris]|uniref:Uncharacterized protein n=1 Tax=Desulfocucumis palustris TaxID=1898651 RepID=A0A2L2XAI1_9FIRM|nr:hypothetical protein DCCM_2277 [Desulfocucumis palustris]